MPQYEQIPIPNNPPSGVVNPAVPPVANPQEPLDPSIVALAKSLGKSESGGNYQARGKDGEVGAYQFTRGFIDNYAPKYLQGYDPENLTPEQQDKLAYNVVKEWGTTGNPAYPHMGKLSPAQIASAWNSGDPDAYLGEHKGVSKGGAPYDTNAYVDKVQKNYEQLHPTASGGLTGFDKSVTLPVAAAGVAGAGLAGGLGMLGGGIADLLGSAWNAIKGVAGNVTKGAIGGVVGDLVNQQLGQQPQQKSQGEDFASKLLNQELPQANKASQAIADVIKEAVSKTPTGRVLMQDPNMQDAVKTMGVYGLSPEVVDGNLDFNAAAKKGNEIVSKLSEGVGKALEGEQSNLSDVVAEAKRNIREHSPSNQWVGAEKDIDEEAAKYAKNFADKKGNISHANLERMKRELWYGQKFNVQDTTEKRAARKALGFAAKATIMKNTQHKEFYQSAMKEEQKLINARKVMKRLNGKKSPEHYSLPKTLLHTGGRMVSIYIGDKIGGALGAVLGDMVGRHIVGAVDRTQGKTIFETPAVRKAIEEIKNEHPEYYKLLISELEKHGVNVVGKGGLLEKAISGNKSKNRQPKLSPKERLAQRQSRKSSK